MEPITGLAADEGKTVRIPVDPVEEFMPSALHEEFDGFVVRSLVHDGQREAGLVAKRLLDIVGAGVGLVLFSPDHADRRARHPAGARARPSCSDRSVWASTVARSRSTSSAP